MGWDEIGVQVEREVIRTLAIGLAVVVTAGAIATALVKRRMRKTK